MPDRSDSGGSRSKLGPWPLDDGGDRFRALAERQRGRAEEAEELAIDLELLEMQRQSYLRLDPPDLFRIVAVEKRQAEIRIRLRDLAERDIPPLAAE